MALLDDILKWSETDLPPWQQDAARRLFQQEDGLSENDYAHLYSLLKAAHGLPNPLNLKPAPLAAAHLPAVLQAGKAVVLKTMRDLKHVNRIASGQNLNFAETGMTVIYGGNGTGKSGYARAMKRACRARDHAEKVLPDANDPNAQIRVPEATFDIAISGTPKSVKWTAGTPSPDELATIAVFDCHCARVYLTAEQDVAFLPYGLDVVENLANKVLPELSRRLNLEIAGINVDRQPFDHLLGDTEVGRLILALSEKSDVTKIKALGNLSEQEIKRIAELDLALAEADPKAKAKELRLSAGRLKALVGRVESALACVTDDAIKKFRNLDDAVVAANQTEKLAAEGLRSGESLLPGTGEPVWKALFDAARKFSTEVAYPGIEFPHTGEGAVCPLCQEPLRNASERLKRFEKYIKDDVAKAAVQQRQDVETAKAKIQQANLAVGLDESLTGELALLDETAAPTATVFQTTLDVRRTWMLEALNSHVWDDAPVLSENPRQKLRNIAARQLKSARTFDRAADETKSKALKAERDELRARHNLFGTVEAVLALIEHMRMKSALESCNQDLKTKPISDKSKEFASSAVTDVLKTALDDEFKALGIGHIGTKLKERNDKGKIKHRLLLDLPTSNKLEEILSEGEQRAIALGSFLAELKLANHSGGIVFDDPVSSLDHKRRGKVAKRMALESLRRQVLVFTHDVVFLHQLRDECDKLKTPPSICFLETAGGLPGIVSEGLPWAHKSFGDRIDKLEKTQKHFAKMPWPADPSEELASEMIRQYSFLRATIERVVQDLVLNATVQRFRDYIEVRKLNLVVGLDKLEVDEILRLNQRCHDVVEAHDPSSAKDEPPPTPEELRQDIEDLKKVIEVIQVRRNKS
jgi:energy-coupling factor transporter ATP-binding protein EcfA2